jgi:Tfp pilus assembly protein PilP
MHLHRTARQPRIALLLLGLAAAPSWAAAQVVPASAVPTAERPAPAPAETYSYEPSGRRDPFLNLLGFTDVQPVEVGTPRHIEGAAGLAVSDTTVRGVMRSGGALIALIQGSDKKTFVVHQGDKLRDGTIKAVVPEGLVIVQAVNDPLSTVKQREVRKLLRSVEDGKQ